MLPYQITVQNKGTITYIYDAAGNKLEKRTYETAINTTTTTSYIGSCVYQQINNVLVKAAATDVRNKANLPFSCGYPLEWVWIAT